MKALLVAAALIVTSSAQAAICTSDESSLKVRVTDSVMVLSNPEISHGSKTIARFTAENGVLDVRESDGETHYYANVDLRFADSARAGEYLMGTRLGEVDTITVYIGENDPYVELTKRNGTKSREYMTCR